MARTAATTALIVVPSVRASDLRRTSTIGDFVTAAVSSSSAKSERLMPRDAARVRSALWTSSGTLRIWTAFKQRTFRRE